MSDKNWELGSRIIRLKQILPKQMPNEIQIGNEMLEILDELRKQVFKKDEINLKSKMHEIRCKMTDFEYDRFKEFMEIMRIEFSAMICDN